MKLSIYVVLLGLVMVVGLTSCGDKVTDEQLTVMSDTVALLEQEVIDNKIVLATVTDPVQRASLQKTNSMLLKQIQIFKRALAEAESISDAKWTTGEAIVGMIGAVFPPALLALPWIRTLRKQRTAIFDSIKAGGGPAMPEAAKLKLMESPAARAAFRKWKIGPAPTGRTSL